MQGGVPSGILVDEKIWVYVNYYDSEIYVLSPIGILDITV